MATVIKSNKIAKKHLGSAIPFLVPKTGLSGIFNFNNGSYESKGSSLTINDIIQTTRSSVAIGLNEDGSETVYPINTTRLHYVKKAGMKGVALGDQLKNFFANSGAPVTQNITIDEGSTKKFFLLVSVKGSGSLTLSGGVSGVVTEGNPLYFKVTSQTITFTATVNGSLTYAQASKTSVPYGVDPSRPSTTNPPSQKTQEVTQVKRPFFDGLYSEGNEVTVFLKMARFDGGDLSLTPNGGTNQIALFDSAPVQSEGGFVGLLDMIDGSKGRFYFRKQKGGAVLATTDKIDINLGDTFVYAFSLSPTNAKMFFDGLKVSMNESTVVNPKLNFLPSLLNDTSSYLAPNWALIDMIVYGRYLQDEEIIKVTNILK